MCAAFEGGAAAARVLQLSTQARQTTREWLRAAHLLQGEESMTVRTIAWFPTLGLQPWEGGVGLAPDPKLPRERYARAKQRLHDADTGLALTSLWCVRETGGGGAAG